MKKKEMTVDRLNNYIKINADYMGMTEEEMTVGLIEKMTCAFNNLSEEEQTLYDFKDSDCGKYGKAFEINVKHFLNGNRGNCNTVSAKGKTDVQSKGVKYEVKSNCGEINDDIMKNDFIIYTPNNRDDYYLPMNAYVIPSDSFVSLFESLGLVRTKKSTNGQLKTTIQSYRNSKRKTAALYNALKQYSTLGEWVAAQ